MDVIQVIQNLGFPIACVVGMGWYIYRITNNYREDIQRLSDARDKAAQEMREALESNTLVISELTAFLKTKLGEEDADA